MIGHATLAKSAPVLGLLLAISVLVPRLNAEAGPPSSVFVRLDPGRPDPRIEAQAFAAKGGEWLLRLDVDGFAFTDICTVVESDEPVGHAHVYADNKKIAAAYEPIISLGKLAPGEHTLRIMLRAQDHRALVGSSGLIERHIRILVG